MFYDSRTANPSCLARSENFTPFYEDLEIDALLLPSNLASIHADKQTANDGYDTSITITGVFVRTFFDLSSLMTDS
jgi:hypothetical protein